ncbi:MAG: T9SS type A sorting domain-containing protein, partial [Candidatus Latescibacteria bacterium]|nr:T9SS type A sorting domain-containing protein [Candidatus Latescibacterota bacterium]
PDIESTKCRIRVTDTIDANVTDMSDTGFTVTKPAFINLINLTGGEELINLNPFEIQWESHRIATVKIEYSSDNGNKWTTIESSIDASTGAYEWAVPDIASTECLVRITDTSDANMFVISAGVFSVIDPTFLTLLIPNGEEELVAGSSFDIQWDSFRISNVRIEYTPDDGTRWVNVVSSTDAATGTYAWTVPDVESANCLVRLTDTADGNRKVLSEASFSIIQLPFIQLLAPGSEEKWSTGSSHEISWKSAYIDNVKLEYSTDGGSSWNPIEDNIDASSGSYTWTVPESISNSCLVKISDMENAENTTTSDVFSIAAQSYVIIISPNGGEDWIAGSENNITWEYGDVSLVNIEFSHDSGSSWNSIAENYDASKGSFSWAVPDNFTSEYLVRIINADDAEITDASDNTFTISPAPYLDLTYPNGGETLTAGTTQSITWESSGVATVKLEYSINGGTDWATIIQSTNAGLGSYNWTMPTIESSAYLVRITDNNKSIRFDVSESTFAISIKPFVEITSPVGDENWTPGSTQNITWSSSGVNNVNIEYSITNGLTWVNIISGISASSYSYFWAVPDELSSECLVRIFDASDYNIADLSDNPFTITSEDFITVTSPRSGDRWSTGFEYEITWQFKGITDVKIDYSDDNGGSWNTIVSSVSASTGSYRWTVPVVLSNMCLVKISDTDDSSVSDISGLFEIYTPEFSITHVPITEAQENAVLTFDATVTSDVAINNVTLYYDVTGRREFDKSIELASVNQGNYTGTIGVGIFTAFGMEYYFTSNDINDTETRLPFGTDYFSINAIVNNAVSSKEIVSGTEVNGYRMISIPLELSQTSIVNQLEGNLPSGNSGIDWRLFRFAPGSTNPDEYPDIEGFGPGKSFWLITKTNFLLNAPLGKTVITSEPFTIELRPGWNDIANPWMFDISWDDIDNPSGADLSVLYTYEGNWSDPVNPPTVLEPWMGYAVKNLTTVTAIVKLNPIPATESEKPVVTNQFDWMLTLIATAGDAKDTANHLGVSERANMEWDRYDHVEPPPVGGYVSVLFPHRDWNKYLSDYTVDFRPPEKTISWDFDVRTNIPGETVTLELEGIEKLPYDMVITIYERGTNREISLFDNTFSFVSGKDITEACFTLVASSYLEQQPKQDNAIPDQFVTAVSYPNPFNPQTTIRYELSHSGKVKVSVFNSLGQRVRVYELGHREQGTHELVFDATELTSGLYFYQIYAGYASITGKMLYMK